MDAFAEKVRIGRRVYQPKYTFVIAQEKVWLKIKNFIFKKVWFQFSIKILHANKCLTSTFKMSKPEIYWYNLISKYIYIVHSRYLSVYLGYFVTSIFCTRMPQFLHVQAAVNATGNLLQEAQREVQWTDLKTPKISDPVATWPDESKLMMFRSRSDWRCENHVLLGQLDSGGSQIEANFGWIEIDQISQLHLVQVLFSLAKEAK